MNNDQTKELRDGMVKFEEALMQQAVNSCAEESHEAAWIYDALMFVARLCTAVRATLPMDKDA